VSDVTDLDTVRPDRGRGPRMVESWRLPLPTHRATAAGMTPHLRPMRSVSLCNRIFPYRVPIGYLRRVAVGEGFGMPQNHVNIDERLDDDFGLC